MVFNEIISIFEKIVTTKATAPAALASLLLLLPVGLVYAIIFLVRLHSTRPIPDGRVLAILLNEMPHGLSITTLALLAIFIISSCFLVVNAIRDFGNALRVVNLKLGGILRKKVKKDKIYVERAKRIRHLLGEEIEEKAEIIRMFYPYKSIVEISTDTHCNALASLEKDKIISIAFSSDKSCKIFIRLNPNYELLVRAFLDNDLDRLIKSCEEELFVMNFFQITNATLTTFFDFVYYPIAYLILLFFLFLFAGLFAPVLTFLSL